MADRNISSYPELVDAVWDVVKGTTEEREGGTVQFSDDQICHALGIPNDASCLALSDGIGQAHRDLVRLRYCEEWGEHNGAMWASVNAPDVPPSARALRTPLVRLSPLRAQILRYANERTVCQEGGITFYRYLGFLLDEVVQDLLLTVPNDIAALNESRNQVVQAAMDLEQKGLIECEPTSATLFLRIRLEGTCWLQVGAPLLDLIDRAAKLTNHPEAIETARIIIEAHTRSEQDAARDLTVAIETLRNAVGGEQQLIALLGKPAPFVKDLMQSSQTYRHASTQATEKLDHAERLARAREIMDLYLLQCAN